MLVLVLLGLFTAGGQMVLNTIYGTPGASHLMVFCVLLMIGIAILYKACQSLGDKELLLEYRLDYMYFQIAYFAITCFFLDNLIKALSRGPGNHNIKIAVVLAIVLIILDIVLIFFGLRNTHSIKASVIGLIDAYVRTIIFPVELAVKGFVGIGSFLVEVFEEVI